MAESKGWCNSEALLGDCDAVSSDRIMPGSAAREQAPFVAMPFAPFVASSTGSFLFWVVVFNFHVGGRLGQNALVEAFKCQDLKCLAREMPF